MKIGVIFSGSVACARRQSGPLIWGIFIRSFSLHPKIIAGAPASAINTGPSFSPPPRRAIQYCVEYSLSMLLCAFCERARRGRMNVMVRNMIFTRGADKRSDACAGPRRPADARKQHSTGLGRTGLAKPVRPAISSDCIGPNVTLAWSWWRLLAYAAG